MKALYFKMCDLLLAPRRKYIAVTIIIRKQERLTLEERLIGKIRTKMPEKGKPNHKWNPRFVGGTGRNSQS